MRRTNLYHASLSALEVFAGCSRRELDIVGGCTTLTKVDAGGVIVREGTFGREAFIVVDGAVEVTVHDLGAEPVAIVGEGLPIGEMALLHRTSRNATVTVARPSLLLVSTPSEFRGVMDQVPSFAEAVESLAERRLLANLAA